MVTVLTLDDFCFQVYVEGNLVGSTSSRTCRYSSRVRVSSQKPPRAARETITLPRRSASSIILDSCSGVGTWSLYLTLLLSFSIPRPTNSEQSDHQVQDPII